MNSTASRTRSFIASILVALAVLAAAAAARAEVIVSRDNEGRTITFDVRAAATDVEWYASVLRAASHGDEISTVTIRIVPGADITSTCGASAVACYGRRAGVATMVVPAGRSERLARVVLHEYGHHLDHAWVVNGVGEPNGTPTWFAAREIERLLSSRLVAFDYSLGWSRSIGEIFAEDYAYVHIPGPFAIEWLSPPDDALRSALLAELNGRAPAPPPATPPPAPASEPVVVVRNGTLAPRAQRTLPFGLVGPGRRVTFTATVGGAGRAGTRARIEVLCDGRRVARRTFGRGQTTRTINVAGLGPADCQARLTSTSTVSHSYVLRLRLAVEAQARAT